MGFEQIQVELQEVMGSDRSIADAAWTSSLDYQKKQTRNDDDVVRVVNMLADNRHSTPFESVIFRFWIHMPIQTDRQHMTHRIATHNGLSGRYRSMPSEWYHPPQDIKQIFHDNYSTYLLQEYEDLCKHANNFYNRVLNELKQEEKKGEITNFQYKRIREFLRGVLPQNNMTERVSIFNLRSFANYQKLRNSEHAQPEIQYVAKLMLSEVESKLCCPIALEALQRNGWSI